MAWTIQAALSDPDIRIVRQIGDTYVVTIGKLKTHVTISLRNRKDGSVWWDQSHAIFTPRQAGPYWTSRPFDVGPDAYPYALHRAISGLTEYYREAVNAGEQPDEDWLVAA